MFGRSHVDDLRFIGERFEAARRRVGLSRVELVREAGYENTAKGCRRIRNIERGEATDGDLRTLERFAWVLEIDLDQLEERIEERVEGRRRRELERHPAWLGRMLRSARERSGSSREEVVRAAGLEPVERYARRLERYESAEWRFPADEELEALCGALGVPVATGRATLRQECAYYDELDGQPVVALKGVPGVAVPLEYPRPTCTERVFAFAERRANEEGRQVVTTLADGRSVFFEPGGDRFESTVQRFTEIR